jgi:TonB family protein
VTSSNPAPPARYDGPVNTRMTADDQAVRISLRRHHPLVVLIAVLLAGGGAITLSAQGPPPPVGPAMAIPPALPALEKQVVPVYPPNAMAAGVQGVVRIEASISPEGQVAEGRVVQSIPLLDQTALDAVRQWQFAPVPGVRVVPITFEFRLTDAPLYEIGHRNSPSVPAWMPPDFAFVYYFECRDGSVRAETIPETLVEEANGQKRPRAWRPSSADLDQLFIKLISGGFFSSPAGVTVRDRRQPVQQLADRIVVEVIASKGQHVHTAGDSALHHELMVRSFGSWRILRWSEPIEKSDGDAAEAAALGAMVRELLARTAEEATPPERRSCLS